MTLLCDRLTSSALTGLRYLPSKPKIPVLADINANPSILFALLGLSLASAFVIEAPVVQEAPVLENLATTNAYAVDFSTYAPVSTFSCLRSAGYSAVFIRGYNPVGDGSYDTNAAANVKNAYSAGIGTEIYMTPVPLSSKSATTEMDEMINGLQNAGITIRSIWIQVKSRNSWYSHSSTNINFLSALISRAQQRGLSVGAP